jgi:hypothetical protein
MAVFFITDGVWQPVPSSTSIGDVYFPVATTKFEAVWS